MRIFGFLLGLVAISINPYSVGLISSGDSLSDAARDYVLIFQASLLLLAALLLFLSFRPEARVLGISIKNIALGYASILFTLYFLVGVEIGLLLMSRSFGARTTPEDDLAVEAFASQAFRDSRNRSDKSFSSPHLTVNALGFRAPPFEPKKDNEKRFVFLGGSTAFGYNVADNHTIPALIEARYREKGVTLRAFNLGLNGSNIWQQVRLLERYFEDIDPDMVILYNGSNEFGAAPPKAAGDVAGAGPMRNQELAADLQATLQRFYTFQLAFALLGALTYDDTIDAAVATQFAEQTKRYASMHQTLNEICARKAHMICLTVFQPRVLNKKTKTLFELIYENMRYYLSPLDSHYNYFIDNTMKEISPHNTVNLLDLRDAFNSIKQGIFIDYVHVNCLGNDVVAGRISQHLDSNPGSSGGRRDSAGTGRDRRVGGSC